MTDSLPTPEALRTAADRLVSALAAHADPEYRLAVLKRLVRRLGEERYPLFLRIVGVVAESDDERAQRLLAETFGVALRRMDLPGGALSSWGATGLPDHGGAPMAASALSGHFFGATPRRMLGPVEYLVVWHLQRTQRTALSADGFRTSLARMIAMLNRSDDARTLYPQKLAADAQNELEGAYTRATRDRLAAIAAAWAAGEPPERVAEAAIDAPAAAAHGWVVRDL
ncbi:hypothetical protein [Luteimonas terricola]|uniref:Uncharacterized protein n=1 Tax=Luteimonas terricola TaxID=645597 RepID=A0ABQ2E8H6_9GAMM|nr:hypothetical protein [Luteimonas terricola]GGJ96162.1 hypothetical protein GCM10011394_01140 [Luteimonas terricola]